MPGTKRQVTSTYHPQPNYLIECKNLTIKNALVKVLDENIDQWLYILNGVLFLASTKLSLFSQNSHQVYPMYNPELVLPVDLKYELNSVDLSEPFDQDIFEISLNSRCNDGQNSGSY